MPSVILSPIGGSGQQFLDSNGNPLAGGLLYTYAAGTTTPQATYTDNTGNTPNANPIVLDSSGRASGVWLVTGTAYKFVLKTSTGTLIGTWDNITGVSSPFQLVGALPTASGSTVGQGYVVTATNPYQIYMGTVLGDGSYGFTQIGQ